MIERKYNSKEKRNLIIHLIWIIGFIIIILIVCSTIIYLNYNAWTLRFEMDNNTLEAIKTIDWGVIGNITQTIDRNITRV